MNLKFLDNNHGEFKSIRIADKFRKNGFGIKIINHLIHEAKKQNLKKIVFISKIIPSPIPLLIKKIPIL